MAQEILVMVTCPPQSSEKIARTLVEERLAACVNILGSVRSVFSWKNQVSAENEELLLIKSHRRVFASLERRVRELHSYEIPEIVSFSIEDGYQPYLDWLNASLVQPQ